MNPLELRIICDPDGEPEAIAALRAVFDLGPVRTYPTRDGTRRRLYLTALTKHSPVASGPTDPPL